MHGTALANAHVLGELSGPRPLLALPGPALPPVPHMPSPLPPRQVLPLLQEQAPEAGATMDDVKYLFHMCDEDGSGTIDRTELQPLLNLWGEIVTKRQEQPKGSGFCVVL